MSQSYEAVDKISADTQCHMRPCATADTCQIWHETDSSMFSISKPTVTAVYEFNVVETETFYQKYNL